jgi:hypothetical protein
VGCDESQVQRKCRKIDSLLFRHVVERVKQSGAARIEWEAEPNALGFYEKMGGRYLRDSQPSSGDA